MRWRTGVVLYDKNTDATAIIRADDRERLIDIRVGGKQKRDYFAVIRGTLNEIHASFQKLTITELVPLPDNPTICLEYQELIGYELAGRDEYFVGKLRKVYSVSALLNGIEKKEQRQKTGGDIHYHHHEHNGDYVEEKNMAEIKQTIVNSTIHGSVLAAEKIENCLNTVQSSQADNDIKQLLSELLQQIADLNSKVPAEVIKPIIRNTEDLVREVDSDEPRKDNSLLSLNGIKDAAIKLGEIAQPILELAEKISPFLQNF